MLHFALVQKEQESLAETEPLPQQGGLQGGNRGPQAWSCATGILWSSPPHLSGMCSTSCLAQTTSTAGLPLAPLWTQVMGICTGSGLIWVVITNRKKLL